MYCTEESRTLTKAVIQNYMIALQEDEKSSSTIAKYVHDLNMAAEYFAGTELTKSALIRWKDVLIEKYATATVNSVLAAINGFLKHMGWNDLMVNRQNSTAKSF